MKPLSMTNQIKATEQYFLVVLFNMLYKVVLTFESVNDPLTVIILSQCSYQHLLNRCLSNKNILGVVFHMYIGFWVLLGVKAHY